MDLLLEWRGRVLPVEIKLGAEPHVTRGLAECMKDLRARMGFVLHSGAHSYPLGPNVWALSAGLLGEPARFRKALLGRS